jgi:hypothetical protein
MALGTLASLLETEEGRRFFNAYLHDSNHPRPEFAKYYNFYLDTVKLTESKGSVEELLKAANLCFENYVAIEADTRLDAIVNRSITNEVEKTLDDCREKGTNPKNTFCDLQQKSLNYLEQNIFHPHIVPLLKEEKEKRISACILN